LYCQTIVKRAKQSQDLAKGVVELVRTFGLHRPEETPCGQPIPVGEAHALMDLAEHGPMNHGQLAARLKLKKSTVSRLVGQLERRGWIARDNSNQDNRVILIRLTGKGAGAAKRLSGARRSKFDRLLASIPKSQRRNVIATLTTLARALEKHNN
jgi:DNA-binding MarR family transcriptional regulator